MSYFVVTSMGDSFEKKRKDAKGSQGSPGGLLSK